MMRANPAAFFQELYGQYRAELLRFADRWVGTPISEDVVEETFLVAWSKIDVLREHTSPKHALYRILHYKCIHEVSRKSYQSELSTDIDALFVPEASPTKGLFEILPVGLPAADQEILLLRFEEGRDFSEIAERLGIQEPAARKRLTRAIGRCRKLLLEPPRGDPEEDGPKDAPGVPR